MASRVSSVMRLFSCLVVFVLLGCGGGTAREPSASVVRDAAGEPSRPTSEAGPTNPMAQSSAGAALAECLAPIDPAVFGRLDRSREPPPKTNLRRRGPPTETFDPCAQQFSVECAYRDARAHFEERRYDLAAAGFRKIAFDGEVTDVGVFAGQLALESLNMIAAHADPPRPACFDVMASDNDKLIERYCDPQNRPQNEESCDTFRRIAQDVRRLRAEQLVTAADHGAPSDALQLHARAGDAYRSLFDDMCTPAMQKVAPRGCDEILYNAYRAYRAARMPEKAEVTRRAFFDPRFGLADTELGKKLAAEGQ